MVRVEITDSAANDHILIRNTVIFNIGLFMACLEMRYDHVCDATGV